MIINFTNTHQFTTNLILKGEQIEVVNKMKILGVTINNQLSWDENTSILVKKVNQRMQLLRAVWAFGSNSQEMVHLWKLYCLSVLEQSCVVWGPSLTIENQDDLERTQKGFAKLVLGHKYQDYESALRMLDLVKLSERRIQLMTNFAKSSIENRKLDKYFILRKSDHPMDLRKPEKYKVTRTNTERFKNSSIPYMQNLLNQLNNNE